jgi:hypothetical protein
MDNFKKTWANLMRVNKAIVRLQGQSVFSILYLSLFSLVSVPLTIFQDPLNIKKKRKSSFDEWIHPQNSFDSVKRPY